MYKIFLKMDNRKYLLKIHSKFYFSLFFYTYIYWKVVLMLIWYENMGNEVADNMKNFCKEHGLV